MISVVIPTYQREVILLDTLQYLCALKPAPAEIILVDQTKMHQGHIRERLSTLEKNRKIRWLHLSAPSIPNAMNTGLKEAKNDIVLFLDDDIVPDKELIGAHLRAHADGHNIVAGQVLQPGEDPLLDDAGVFRFRSGKRQQINELMGGNFSIKRQLAMKLGGFDENFVHVAYRFEAEFADRALSAGENILFEPAASIRHLKAERGGTRSYGEHLRTIMPSHSVGEYYYLMRSQRASHRIRRIISRPFRAVRTRHHLRRPWWIPLTFISELLGFAWAIVLYMRGPEYIKKY